MVNIPYISFVGGVFDVIANGFEHSAGGCQLTTIENLFLDWNMRFFGQMNRCGFGREQKQFRKRKLQ